MSAKKKLKKQKKCMSSTFTINLTLMYDPEDFKEYQRETVLTVNTEIRHKVARMLHDIADGIDCGINCKVHSNGNTWEFRDVLPNQTFWNELVISNAKPPCPEQK